MTSRLFFGRYLLYLIFNTDLFCALSCHYMHFKKVYIFLTYCVTVFPSDFLDVFAAIFFNFLNYGSLFLRLIGV